MNVADTMIAAARFIVLMALADAALAASWSCYGTKPGHPTPPERTAFVNDVSRLAVAAERQHGVPASALAALAIAESGYGFTRLAVEANNVFAWKAGPVDVKAGRSHVPRCQRRGKAKDHFLMFETRAEAFDLVAARLATLDGYREYTDRYREARKRGQRVEPAVQAWVAGIAKRYSRSPAQWSGKLNRIMSDPEGKGQGAAASKGHNLYELSRKASAAK